MLRAQKQAEAPVEVALIPFQVQQLQSPGGGQAVDAVALGASVAESAAAVRFGRSGRSRGLGGRAQFRTV
jgi:hypothetical protein